ncbi:Kynureninase [Arsukibacterium tuosuense]|uniref:Kynureninase n=1 Tax=Arsukibacterium tuosuense TaxID=1323745 RepID=A0A285I0Z2_9GAMM|nr:kynureninase [Arsukibacterium tuosuense]SNY41652.1 Kynureninase [Arsukibacterium tuosuense]
MTNPLEFFETNTSPLSRQLLQHWDSQDLLAAKRDAFVLPENTVYLDGNSLGAMPRMAAERAQQVLAQQWSQDLIKSWNQHSWIDLPGNVGEKIARLVGAASGQVICCDSTSVNLFKVLSSAMLMQPDRKVVLSQAGNFPTDLYMVEGLASLLGEQNCRLKLVEDSENDQLLRQALTEEVAVLMLTQVDFRSGRLLDMQRLTELAHGKGILVIWDLAHSAGALPIELDACQVDFAIGCGYKYLNGGPGAPAFIYAATRHHNAVRQPLSGWMGHSSPFSFDKQYQKAPGISQFLTGTPAIISMSVLDAALDVFADVDMAQLRLKSLALSNCFQQLVQQHNSLKQLTLLTPIRRAERGSQLAYQHPAAYALCQALIQHGVIADFRAPDILRLGFTPLYLRYVDIWQAVTTLAELVQSGEYSKPAYAVKNKVT